MGDMPAVQVLLATYNGVRFVREQIESILAQDYPSVTLLARDDGSTDGTQDILNEYAARLPSRFRVLESGQNNQGFIRNFLELMKASSADYVCLSDQDDVWLPDKVSRTVQAMRELERKWGSDIPLLVFTDLRVVDEYLTTLQQSFWNRMRINPAWVHHLEKLLGSPVVTGCTTMSNRRLVELAQRMPDEAALHDRWMALLASALGNAAFLPDPTVLYRQHGRNAVGTGSDDTPARLYERVRDTPRRANVSVERWRDSQRKAALFLRTYEAEVPPAKRKILEAFLACETSSNRFVRVAIFLRYRFYFTGRLSRLALISYLWSGRPAEQPHPGCCQ